MSTYIDPTIDFVFKRLFAVDANKSLLMHFLNAYLELEGDDVIKTVTLKDPYNDKEYKSAKLSIVDVRCIDQKDRTHHVEIQVSSHPGMDSRMLWNWSALVYKQLDSGEDYFNLKPVISIWIFVADIFKEIPSPTSSYLLLEKETGEALCRDFRIEVLELKKLGNDVKIKTEKDRWMWFFKDGGRVDLDAPPKWMNTSEMRKAADVMRTISKKESDFDRYLSRVDKRREELTQVAALRKAIESKDEAKRAVALERREKESALKLVDATRLETEKERREKMDALKLVDEERREKNDALKLVDASRLETEKERREKEAYRQILIQAGIELPDLD